MEKDTPLWFLNLKNKFQDIGNSQLTEVSHKSIDETIEQVNHILINDEITDLHKKWWLITTLNEVIINNDTPTWDPYYLVGYIKFHENLSIVDALKKYNTSILETVFWYRVEMWVIWESHTLEIYDNNWNILASEIVACLPLDNKESMYELKDKTSIRIKKDWYDHKIMRFNSDALWEKLWTTYHHWKDVFFSIQEDLIQLWEPQCYYEFPFDIEIEHDWKHHKVQTAWVTALKAFSIEKDNERKIVTYTIHWYKKKWGLVTWDAPNEDTIIVTRSIFDLNKLSKK